ncbi:O-methyltransferase [Bacillus sp. Marseille-P3661]|uniref:O-methyltransferase n=1 Tax=Bacillus sp. Marseille-P3661 TaxID=1936234 RepID=UPI000C815C5B|nr:O-methyltransferase [Bacillus sp. Marseille-P3661]
MFTPNEITNYIESLIPAREEEITKIENYAKEHGVPIMELVGIEAMLQLLRLQQPKTILEIGTAIGYSAIRMARALPNSNVISIERDQHRYEKAIENINNLNLQNQIKVYFGDALQLAEQVEMDGPYDCLFIDAAKGQYRRFFELYSPMMTQNGAIYSDNILFRGHVANENIVLDNKRHRAIIDKIKAYNQWLMTHKDYETVILTVGDGIAISRKR